MHKLVFLAMIPTCLFSMDKAEQSKADKARAEIEDAYFQLGSCMDLDRCLDGRCLDRRSERSVSDVITKVETLIASHEQYCDQKFYNALYINDVLSCLTYAQARLVIIDEIGKAHTARNAQKITAKAALASEDLKALISLKNTQFMMAESRKAVKLLEIHEEKMRKKAGL